MMMGDIDTLLSFEPASLVAGADEGIRVIGLGLAGRRDEAKRALIRMRRAHIPAFQSWTEFLLAWLEGRTEDMLARISSFDGLKVFDDPEAIFQEGRFLCDIGEHGKGMDYLSRAVAKGYSVLSTLQNSREFEALRGDPAFQSLMADAATRRDAARAAFQETGGRRLLGSGHSIRS
jgi:hypothetical protein